MYYLTIHGESLRRIELNAGLIILGCGLAYPFAGGIKSSETNTVHEFSLANYYAATTPGEILRLWFADTLPELLWGLYFSVITFTTIGYGDLYPVGTYAKVLVGVESLAGAVLVALFVFVLGRRVAR